jgi:chromosome partitioning protein
LPGNPRAGQALAENDQEDAMTDDAGGRRIASYSEKGGVGKTSVTAGIAAVAAEEDLAVLAVDLDPRATLTKELGVDEPERSLNDLLYVDPDGPPPGDPAELVSDAIVPAGPRWPSNVRVLPSERPLGRREIDGTPGMELRLRRALEGLRGEVDLVLMDCPPRAGGRLVGSALIAASHVLIPATLTEDGYDGASEALRSIGHYAAPGGPNPGLVVAGIVRSIVPRDGDMRDVHRHHAKALKEDFGELLLETVIRTYAVREECRTACVPITAAPGREAKLLTEAYREVLHHVLAAKEGR